MELKVYMVDEVGSFSFYNYLHLNWKGNFYTWCCKREHSKWKGCV